MSASPESRPATLRDAMHALAAADGSPIYPTYRQDFVESVACPQCGAARGEWCRTRRGPRESLHRARLTVTYEARRAERARRDHELRKVTGQRLAGLRLQFDRVAIANSRQRNPSHFGSYCHWSPLGISSTTSASVGGNGRRSGSEAKEGEQCGVIAPMTQRAGFRSA